MTDQERDLGVLVDSSMKVSTQCAVEVKKVNSKLGIISSISGFVEQSRGTNSLQGPWREEKHETIIDIPILVKLGVSTAVGSY